MSEEIKKDESKETLKILLREIEGLKKDRDILMQAADKKALARYYARHREDLPKVVKIRTIDGKLILGWRTLVDKGSFQIPGTGKWTEEQKIEVLFEDGNTQEMHLMDFNRRYESIKAKKIGVIEDAESGQIAFKVRRMDNGEVLTIGAAFVN